MINLINNEFVKIKKSKLFLSYISLIVILIIMNKYGKRNIYDSSFNLIPVFGIIMCLFYGGSISHEIESGTLRYYLTKPFKRWKIYLSKYISMFLYLIIGLYIIMISTCLISSKLDFIYMGKFLCYSIPLVFMLSFILFCSVCFKNTSFNVALCVLTLSFSLILSQLLFGIEFNIIEYTFLPYLDYSLFDDNLALKEMNSILGINLSLNRGIIIDLVYSFIFYMLGLFKFLKKDIKS